MSSRSIPDIQIIPFQAEQTLDSVLPAGKPRARTVTDLRQERIKEFLQARSLAPKSQRAYQQDLQRFLNWTERNWSDVTPRQVAQFKAYLLRTDPLTDKRVLSDATVNRSLGTLKNFYGWMFRSRYVSHDPTTEVDQPKLKEPLAQNLNDNELELIYQAVYANNLRERNLALISVLLHGLRASEVSGQNRNGRQRRCNKI